MRICLDHRTQIEALNLTTIGVVVQPDPFDMEVGVGCVVDDLFITSKFQDIDTEKFKHLSVDCSATTTMFDGRYIYLFKLLCSNFSTSVLQYCSPYARAKWSLCKIELNERFCYSRYVLSIQNPFYGKNKFVKTNGFIQKR